MLAQYIHAAPDALFRIISHGRRWRALRADEELGRYESADEAVRQLSELQPTARLPRRLADWRYLPASALAHLPPPTPASLARLASAA
ncbi:hypothetical protein [Luteibacter aegosomatissinici]|uniref:hypothetical protein n=1 Tax=Luteibacter aegosomatissinici TaxID=2911539 RepID=UPI001FF997FC|nr:hypothetical protein [Luteibacter aegosomatissinici]UPG93369.1 hypothetical protein L2Y97_16140 [Luteibacter aegosomatissinici]